MPDSTARPYITCHVLDTIQGKPGANINVQLRLLSSPSTTTATHLAQTPTSSWEARTNEDGRVAQWVSSSGIDVNEVVEKAKQGGSGGEEEEGTMTWSLTFDTETYFGRGNTFWPEVELKFRVRLDEPHYHVPLLLGPWSFTTYRGS